MDGRVRTLNALNVNISETYEPYQACNLDLASSSRVDDSFSSIQ